MNWCWHTAFLLAFVSGWSFSQKFLELFHIPIEEMFSLALASGVLAIIFALRCLSNDLKKK